MAPPALRKPLGSLIRCKSSQTISLPTRTFASSSRLCLVGPEHPHWIEVPRLRQRDAIPEKDIKGTLPPPRNLFPRTGPNKTSEEYLASAAREPTTPRPAADGRILWKQEMAANRRTNLRQSLVELKKRQEDTFNRKRSITAVKRAERKKALNAPQREDERLTNPTITAAMSQLQIGAVPDPGREERIAEKRARVAAIEDAKAEARKDALHTLYMHARDFIVTEEQLNNEVDKLFVEKPFPNHPNQTSIFDAFGAPQKVQEMLEDVNNTQKKAIDYHKGPAKITGLRLKRIAEELTGGKMEEANR